MGMSTSVPRPGWGLIVRSKGVGVHGLVPHAASRSCLHRRPQAVAGPLCITAFEGHRTSALGEDEAGVQRSA